MYAWIAKMMWYDLEETMYVGSPDVNAEAYTSPLSSRTPPPLLSCIHGTYYIQQDDETWCCFAG
jgi:hypothetical protein